MKNHAERHKELFSSSGRLFFPSVLPFLCVPLWEMKGSTLSPSPSPPHSAAAKRREEEEGEAASGRHFCNEKYRPGMGFPQKSKRHPIDLRIVLLKTTSGTSETKYSIVKICGELEASSYTARFFPLTPPPPGRE